ncbi:hypothetical protein Lepto7376_0041 [[Leptolyngbya] sp. PCC 7376]|uniref:hypothetical protein n=1 Tax=[Leptolyngbya] sp. PCC 7376 TaxID=111781 RepID=UPI00029F30BC|nr:hypothetical protein [[Leptolyngbya] sp. PCC 7376]AFY36501.1 hypothetical protein Lepto7376_0041 [[Leptolyngbya] sp. PCC 7376]
MAQKTIKELIAEMSFRTVEPEEIEAAREYERSQIPDDLEIPQTGQIFETVRDVEVTAMITYSAPVTGGEEFTLPAGTQIKIQDQTDERPIVIAADPIDYEGIEQQFIPEADRLSPRYSGYFLYIDTVKFVDGFRQIKP